MLVTNKQPENLDLLSKYLVNNGAVIAGGYARKLWCIQDEEFLGSRILPTDDIDFWFKDEETYEFCISLVRTFTSDGGLSPNGCRYHWLNTCYNLIRPDVRPFKSVEGLLDSFDFTVCQAALDKDGMYVTEAFLRDVIDNDLRFVHDHKADPLEAMTRIVKYVAKGFVIEKRLILDLFQQYASMDSQYRDIIVARFNMYEGQSYASL